MEIASVHIIHPIKPPTRRQENSQRLKASPELRITYESGCIWLEGERGRVAVPLTNVACFVVAPQGADAKAKRGGTSEALAS